MSPFVTFLGTIKITYPVIWKMNWHMENNLIKMYGHSSWRTFLSIGKLGPISIVRAKVFQRASFFLSQVSGPILCDPLFPFPVEEIKSSFPEERFLLVASVDFCFPSLLGESLSKIFWSHTCRISCCFLELTGILFLENWVIKRRKFRSWPEPLRKYPVLCEPCWNDHRMAGRGGEERGCRLDGPREAAKVVVGRPGFESSSRGWVLHLGQVSPSVSWSSNGCCEDHRNTGRAIWSIATQDFSRWGLYCP